MTDTLVLLHVIVRHGDRTPNISYPKDPHKDYDYSPFGMGQLTNAGRKRAYRLGQSLSQRYSRFIGDFYKPEHLDAWTSDTDRTKMTLQLVLASLFQPRNEQIWHESVPWQPIPYNCSPQENDRMFLGFHYKLRGLPLYRNHLNGAGKDALKPYKKWVDYIEHHSGIQMDNSPRHMFNLASTLSIQEIMGLKLPEWTNVVWPNPLEEIAALEYEFLSPTLNMKSLLIGKLFQKIVQDSLLKIQGHSEYKLHLYSAHDFTIAILLRTLDLFDCRNPDFCSNIAIELHKIDGIYGIMIIYQRSENDNVKLLKFANMGSFWPIEDFVEQHRDILQDKSYDVEI